MSIFDTVAAKKPKKTAFDLTHDVKMSGDIGLLLPNLVLDCLPGDKYDLGANLLARFAPMLAPIMHRVDIYQHYWFVPYRILWDGWEHFITNDPDDPRVIPYFDVSDSTTNATQKQYLDYFGIPPAPAGSSGHVHVNAFAMAAYSKIYNNWYRDQNLITEVTDTLIDGANSLNDFGVLFKRAWEHDYFTSCLPFAQKGNAVQIPMGDVYLKNDWYAGTSAPLPYFADAAFVPSGAGNPIEGHVYGSNVGLTDGVSTDALAYNPHGSLAVNATTINDLRRAEALQEWLELNARAGSRYTESIEAHFNVYPQDSRLQLPEYITGIKAPVIISEVLNTNGPFETYDGAGLTTTGSAQGDMSGHAVAVSTGHNGHFFVPEHGCIIGIISVMPKTAYQQGVPRMYLKKDFEDFGFPKFAHLGEQEVHLDELYAYGATNPLFGYIPRYAEYKFMPSRVVGDFRTTLNYWHMGRIFSVAPTLSKAFIECSASEVARVFNVEDASVQKVWIHVLHTIEAVRPLPFFGTPKL